MTVASQLRMGVIVPCRNEAPVIERKLANLARLAWPPLDGARHRVILVDDGSNDETAARAALGIERHFGAETAVRVELVSNSGDPGKVGAVTCALRALVPEVDLIVLTDADVILADDALVELARSFARDERLTMACGAQNLVRALPEDGTARSPAGDPPEPAAGLFDRITARVRRGESAVGRLFSVHGQLLAWRASARLAPTPGVAADDLDLMLSARAGGGRVVLVQAAGFFEVKARDEVAGAQAIRRARAYLQALRGRHLPLGSGLLSRLQWWFYRWVPPAAPWVAVASGPLLVVFAWWLAGGGAALLCVGLLLAVSFSPVGRKLRRLLNLIETARRLERKETLDDRWEMQRT